MRKSYRYMLNALVYPKLEMVTNWLKFLLVFSFISRLDFRFIFRSLPLFLRLLFTVHCSPIVCFVLFCYMYSFNIFIFYFFARFWLVHSPRTNYRASHSNTKFIIIIANCNWRNGARNHCHRMALHFFFILWSLAHYLC